MTTRFAVLCGGGLCLALAACSGGSSGNETATGGAAPTSGGSGTGGSEGQVSGGQISMGGQLASGGQSSGGQVSSGGQSGGTASGGQGSPAKGGSAGMSSGGKSTGGASTAGASTGGATAGAASGGQSAGGASSGCGMAGVTSGMQSKMLMVGGQARSYVLSIPSGYSATTPMPLVFAWHGLGGSGSLARQYFRIEQAAANKAVFVYPDGLPIASQSNQAGWDLGANGIDVAFFDALLKEVSASVCVDSNRVFSAGHSFGAMMTNALGCYRGDVLRAIAPVAGGPPNGGRGGATCTGEVAAWLAHGENDTTVDFMKSGIPSRDFWLTRNGCTMTSEATTPSPCVAYQGCRDGLPVHWCVHQNMHDWPSFAGAGIWAFFAGFS